MGRVGLLGAVCAGVVAVAGQVFGAAYLYDGTPYSQAFEGLTWSKSGSGYSSGFGAETSNTVGWMMSAGNSNAQGSYYYRQYNTASYNSAAYSGAPVITSSQTTLADKSIANPNPSTTNSTYVGIYLTNSTTKPIDAIQLAYTAELWMNPSQAISNWILEYKVGSLGYVTTQPWSGFTSPTQADVYSFPAGSTAGAELHQARSLSNLGWDPGEQLVLRWTFPPGSAAKGQVVGLDDFTLSVPEPSVALMVFGVVLAALALRQRRVAVA